MVRQLNSEFAQSVKLPYNPLRRNQAVRAMLQDSSIIGDGIEVIVSPDGITDEGPSATVEIVAGFPLLGRGTLKQVAQALFYIDNETYLDE